MLAVTSTEIPLAALADVNRPVWAKMTLAPSLPMRPTSVPPVTVALVVAL